MEYYFNKNMEGLDVMENWIKEYERLKAIHRLHLWFGYKADEYPTDKEEIMGVLVNVHVGDCKKGKL